MNKLKKIESHFYIKDRKIVYSANIQSRIDDFKKDNEGAEGEIIYKIIDNITEYYQHKWYRGYLLPAIARECYDDNVFKAHIEMKKMFLFESVTDYGEIPKKYQGRCIPIENHIIDRETGEIVESKLIGYLPSTADIGIKRMDMYIKQVEQFSQENNIPIGYDKEQVEIRNMAYGQGRGQDGFSKSA